MKDFKIMHSPPLAFMTLFAVCLKGPRASFIRLGNWAAVNDVSQKLYCRPTTMRESLKVCCSLG